MEACTFNRVAADAGHVSLPCLNEATMLLQDKRPLPDGKLRPSMPACTQHAGILASSKIAPYRIVQ